MIVAQGNRTLALGEALRRDAEVKGDVDLATASGANSTTAGESVQVSRTPAPLADYYPDASGAGGAGGAGGTGGADDDAGARRRAAAIGELLRPPLVPRLELLPSPTPQP